MGTLLWLLLAYWWVPGLILSALWGWRGVDVFRTDKRPRWESFSNFTVNFVGSFAGWCCLYAVAARTHSALPDLRALNGGDALLFFISLLGIMGNLPQAVLGLVSSFEALIKAIASKAG